MSNKSLADELEIMITSLSNNNPAPLRCTITKVYEDNIHVDVKTDYGEVIYVETIGNHLKIGNIGIIIFLDGNEKNRIIITN